MVPINPIFPVVTALNIQAAAYITPEAASTQPKMRRYFPFSSRLFVSTLIFFTSIQIPTGKKSTNNRIIIPHENDRFCIPSRPLQFLFFICYMISAFPGRPQAVPYA